MYHGGVTRPAVRDVDAYQGDTFTHELRFVDVNGQAVDVSARTFTSQVRRRWSDATVDATFVVNTALAATGVVTFSLAPAVTTALEPGEYRYDIQQVVSGAVLTLLRGRFRVVGEITR